MTPRQAVIPLPTAVKNDEHILERRLPSGRSLLLRTEAGSEELEIRSASGDLDIKITLTDAGPVVSLRGARLEVESPDVAFRCRTFDVQTSGDLSLRSEREVRIVSEELRARTERDIHLNGAYVRLNCTDDLKAPVQLRLPTMDVAAVPADSTAACCHDSPHEPHEPNQP